MAEWPKEQPNGSVIVEHVHTDACRNTYPDCGMETPTTAELVGAMTADVVLCFRGCGRVAEFEYQESIFDVALPGKPVCADCGRDMVPWFDDAIAEQDEAAPLRQRFDADQTAPSGDTKAQA